MKRSDMQALIYECLRVNHLADQCSNHAAYVYATKILDMIEKEGMLPPLKHHKDFGICGSLDSSGRMHFKFEWEPELNESPKESDSYFIEDDH